MLIESLTSLTAGTPARAGVNSSGSPNSGAADFADAVASVPHGEAGEESPEATSNPDTPPDSDPEAEARPEDTAATVEQSEPTHAGSEPEAAFAASQAEDAKAELRLRHDIAPDRTDTKPGATGRDAVTGGTAPLSPHDPASTARAQVHPDAVRKTGSERLTNPAFGKSDETAQAALARVPTEEARAPHSASLDKQRVSALTGTASGSNSAIWLAQTAKPAPVPEAGSGAQTPREAANAPAPQIALRQAQVSQAAQNPGEMVADQSGPAFPTPSEAMSPDGDLPTRPISSVREDLFPAQTRLEAASLGLELARDMPKPAQAETARAIAAQINDVLIRRGNGSFELALRPEELGRVRVLMKPIEGAMTLTIIAERPETLDLMRRHIDQLASEFRDMGYSAVHVDLSGAGDGKGDNQTGHGPDAGASGDDGDLAAPAPEANASTPMIHDLAIGLDMRL
ncbi:flagellar hook-length control protein FliK [Ruegeria sp. 2205SS24-7]|uniref:flagellar hook-length control protein FliK n=1 Tax=Ruegeria discodermiae TaxID=3064389 RepID=UPI00274252AE|nr:flagellar hook-length control protein FliK [Ruegeria sp. 2205SS24-7]MDP5218296.1 flagellar hook-length control protein FliK [Ruegeria sp. 2205SS24-7]